MTDRTALLAAVLANPADDLPRLVYADWLEENGEEDRAALIRLQLADEDHGRQIDLLTANLVHWLPASVPAPRTDADLRLSPSWWKLGGEADPFGCEVEFRRGFVVTVALHGLPAVRPAHAPHIAVIRGFRQAFEAIFAEHPVEAVSIELLDAERLFIGRHGPSGWRMFTLAGGVMFDAATRELFAARAGYHVYNVAMQLADTRV